MNEYEGKWLSTQHVPQFHFLDPQPDEILIEDIAHALSLTCRFGGHCKRFYSVAEHSVRVAGILEELDAPKEYQLAGLLHDAEEAYLPDIPRPVKAEMPEAKKIYTKLNQAILSKFGVFKEIAWDIIYDLDNRICHTEAIALGVHNKEWRPLGVQAKINKEALGWYPEVAEAMFLETYRLLTKRGGSNG